jgi:hypothetical protein
MYENNNDLVNEVTVHELAIVHLSDVRAIRMCRRREFVLCGPQDDPDLE